MTPETEAPIKTEMSARDIIEAVNNVNTITPEVMAQLKAKIDSLPPAMRKKLEAFFNIQENKARQNANKKAKRRTANKIASESRRANRK